jgi:UDP:flavonoid glycosyltransferase YjiC (YdhE family)
VDRCGRRQRAQRLDWAGVGINLRTGRPSPGQVRRAVRAVLDTPGYRARARALQAELARHDALTRAAELLEQLAATGKPVLGGPAPHPTPSGRV